MFEYIVSVMPPSDEDAEPFGIPEWEFDAAVATANRYRERGWRAFIRTRAIGRDRTGSRRMD